MTKQLFISANGRNKIPSGPETLAFKISAFTLKFAGHYCKRSGGKHAEIIEFDVK